MASHDLREPLRTIGVSLSCYPSSIKAGSIPQADEYIAFIQAAVARMNNLITDLLAYSSVPNSEVSPTANTPSQAALQETLWNLRAAIDDSGAAVTHGELPQCRSTPSSLANSS